MATIFAISSMSKAPIPEGMTDHQGHNIGYALLAVFMLLGLADARWKGVTIGSSLSAIVLSTVYGLTDEWHQSFVPGRSPAWDDVAADFAGALAGAALVLILHIINKLWSRVA